MDKIEQLKYHYQEILKLIGEDVEREGLLKTPERAAKAIVSLTKGYEMDAVALLQSAIFTEDIQKSFNVLNSIDPSSENAVEDACTGSNPREIGKKEMGKLFTCIYNLFQYG